jgi:drug/metabolite transporter (DMT)-like permease
MVIGLCGSVLIAKPSFLFWSPEGTERKSYSSYFVLVPISGSVVLGFGYSLLRKVGTDVSSLLVSIIVSAFCAADGLAFQLISGDTFQLPGCYLDRVMVFCSGSGVCLFLLLLNRGMTLEKSGVGTVLISCDVPIAYVIQIYFFHKVPNFTSVVGACLVVSSAVLVILDKIFCDCFSFEI